MIGRALGAVALCVYALPFVIGTFIVSGNALVQLAAAVGYALIVGGAVEHVALAVPVRSESERGAGS